MVVSATLALILGAQAAWTVNDHNTLIWNGEPYLPVGLRIPGSPDEVRKAKEAGIADVIVDLPADGTGWAETILALEQGGMRYLIAVDSLAPMATGFIIEPQSYRVPKLASRKEFSFRFPGCDFALATTVNARDGSLSRAQRIQAEGGRLTFELQGPTLDSDLYLYGRIQSLKSPDYWEGFDARRDEMLSTLTRVRPGAGFRGLLNPLGRMPAMGTASNDFVPDSELLRIEFADYLRQRYRSVETAMRAWSMSSAPVRDFRHLARLVPLWSSTRGPSRLWDPKDDSLYPCEPRQSNYWNDLKAVVAQAETKRFASLTRSLQALTGAPVVQEFGGWASVYEKRSSGLTGIGARATGTALKDFAHDAGPAVSTGMRWGSPCWMLATALAWPAKPTEQAAVMDLVAETAAMGIRGWYFQTRDADAIRAIAQEAASRATDFSLAQWKPKPLFFPANALNPAHTARLPNGYWWLPSPADGDRLDFGSRVFGYRYREQGQSFVAVWTTLGGGRVKLRMLDPKVAKFETVDGFDPSPKIVKGGVEVTLSDTPLRIYGTEEVPVPEPSFEETVQAFDALLKLNETIRVDLTEERFFFKDGLNAMDRNPFSGYELLRNQVDKASRKVGRFVWLEAENMRTNNFSAALTDPSASQRGCLSLTSPLALDSEPFAVDVALGSVLAGQEVEVWLAARIPERCRPLVSTVVNDVALKIAAPPVEGYGNGFAWFRMGVTRLKPSQNRLRIQVEPTEGIDLAIDAVVLSQPGFRPSATRKPF
ncbi:MAG: hypothetical protein H3C58_07075 [Fimbriimonadaceae bacterium]|nr:hypothetical protein [Fimbriimonadaceae bacterium]